MTATYEPGDRTDRPERLDRRDMRQPIAVVGVSALFPGSTDSTGFWRDILAGTDRITEVPSTHWLVDDYFDPDPSALDKTYGRRGGFLDDVELDAIAFGIPPNQLPSTDTAQLLALIVAQRVLDDAVRNQFAELDRSRISVILGVTSGQELMGAMVSRMNRPLWLQGMRRAGVPEDVAQAACAQIANLHPEWTESTFPGLLGNVVAGRIANRLDLGGTNCVTDAACASSFSAISMGINELYLGDSDMVIAGGVDTMNEIFMYMCFSKTPALSKSEDIRPFSEQADGTMLGEGIGMVALKRLADAERDGNNIYCVIDGVGSSSDGRSKSVYAPVSAGQARALDNAYAKAGYGPDTVELVEAHGTGTVAGDAAEFGGLAQVFDASGRADRQWCALGSVKSQIGHTKAAAGAAGLFKVVMALHHKVLPQTAKIDRPNPKLDLESSPFHLNTRSRPWVRGSDHERRGSVSSFGFGGSNFHIALSEYTGSGVRAPRLRTADVELVVLTGLDGADVVAQARTAIDSVSADGSLVWLARSTQRSYCADAAARLAVVASDEADLRAKLAQAIERIEADPTAPFNTPSGVHFGTGAPDGDVAFVFPGQGSQYPFMGAGLAMQYGEAMAAWDLAADQDWGDTPLQSVVFPIASFGDGAESVDEALLTSTQWAQPAIGTASLASLRLLRSIGVEPVSVAGHSFGEITALHAAGVLSEADMIRVARRRGELMAEAAQTPGSMTAVSASIDRVRALLDRTGIDVVIANHNSHSQVVLSGRTDDIERIEGEMAGEGLAFKRLPVATAFHSPVVSGAAGAFAAYLDTLAAGAPNLPVYSNETAAAYPGEPAAVREQLGRQLASPVRFVEIVEAMYAAGVRTFVEVGPGSVLTGLVDRILDDRPHVAIPTDNKRKPGLAGFVGCIGRLVAAGVPMDLDALWREYAEVTDPRDIARPKLALAINGANAGRPYPPRDLSQLAGPNPVSTAMPVPVPASPVSQQPAEPAVAVAPVVASATADATPQPIAPVPAASTAAPAASVLAAFQAVQQQTAEAHAAYLNSMAQVHSSFLDAARQSMEVLGRLSGATSPTAGPVAPAVPTVTVAAPMIPIAPTPAPATVPAAPAPVAAAPVAAAPVAAAPVAAAPVAAAPAAPAQVVAVEPVSAPVVDSTPVAVAVAPAPVGSVPGGFEEMRSLLLAVVADKTGYPAEMLSMGMELESDLGIDSIKRVEILSAMYDAVPELPEVDTAVMAELMTLGQIVDHLYSRMPTGHAAAPAPIVTAAPTVSPAAVPAAPTAAEVAPAGGAGGFEEMRSLLLAVVADKTGYPAEMLSMGMELESDLGIDSIKRVEILSAMYDAVPELPEVDTAVMAELMTLGQIVDHLHSRMPGADLATSATSAEPAIEPSSGPAVDPSVNGTAPTVHATDHSTGTSIGISTGESVASETTRRSGVSVDAPLGRFVLDVVEAPRTDVELSGMRSGRIAVTDDGGGIGTALVAALRLAGVDAELVATVPAGVAGVVFLGGLRAVSDIDAAVAVNREAFVAARTIAPSPAVFVTVSELGGEFGCRGVDQLHAWTGGLTALARTAAIEWPEAGVKAIDVDRGARSPSGVARAIADELLHGGPELEVGLGADGRRISLASKSVPVAAGTIGLDPGDVVVVSGGARGVTAATMIELATATAARFVLLGRSPIVDEPVACRGVDGDAALKRALLDAATAAGEQTSPAELGRRVAGVLAGREIRRTIASIERVGARARYVAVDITDAAAVAAALVEVRAEMGPITAIVHGAGVLADKLIVDKTDEQFDAVFDTKVAGLRSLLAATAGDPVRLLCMFSSVAARGGNTGQSDYAMANEVLNKVAVAERVRRGPSCLVKSLGWGPWAGGMVGPALEAHFAAMGVPVIPLDQGARMLVDEISSPQTDQVEVVLGGAAMLEPRRPVAERADA